jgi:hypothetical protein
MDLLESCFPYALLRTSYHTVYNQADVQAHWIYTYKHYQCELPCILYKNIPPSNSIELKLHFRITDQSITWLQPLLNYCMLQKIYLNRLYV